MTFIEEEIDRLNESFLHLSVQLQQKLHADMQSKVTEDSAGNSFVVNSWNLTHLVIDPSNETLVSLKMMYSQSCTSALLRHPHVHDFSGHGSSAVK